MSRAAAFGDAAAKDMINVVAVLHVHACMHRGAAVMDELKFGAGGPFAE